MKSIADIRRDFPILATTMHGKPLTYLDNAATTQKPMTVISAVQSFYEHGNANVHRGMYELSENATAAYEAVRDDVKTFLNAQRREEIVFTHGTTEAINLVASTWGRANVTKGDTVLVTDMEHHSNLVPWQQLCLHVGATLMFVPITDNGILDVQAYKRLLEQQPKLVALTAFSNVLGTKTPVKELVKLAHAAGAVVVVDAAQAAARIPIDVQSWNADFVALSAHKMYGPTGVGALYAKETFLAAMQPFQFGGNMIMNVQRKATTWNDVPYKFEAGTPNIVGTIGFGAALRYLRDLGWETIVQHEQDMTKHLLQVLDLNDVRVYGPTDLSIRGGVAAFTINGIHPHDIATIFDAEGIAIRSGHHCSQIVMDHFQVPAMARASVGVYTTTEELDRIPRAIERAREILTKR